jgi:hypothetical protein
MSKMSLWQKWKRVSLPNKLMVVSTGIMAFATICLVVAGVLQYLASRDQLTAVREQANIMQKQLDAMNNSSNQTNDLIAATRDTANASQDVARQNGELVSAAQKQANSSITQANASQTQANTSVAQAEVAKQALAATQSSARATEQATQIAARSFALTQQPNVTTSGTKIENFAVGKHPTIRYLIMNNGSTPIHNVVSESKLHISATPPPTNFPVWDEKLVVGYYGGFMPAGGTKAADTTFTNWQPTEEMFSAITTGSVKIYVLGEIRYRDGLRRKWHYRFCGEYMPADGSFLSCGENNEPLQPEN